MSIFTQSLAAGAVTALLLSIAYLAICDCINPGSLR